MEFETDFGSEYLYAEVKGVFDLNKAKQIFEELIVLCDEHGYSKLLIDVQGLEGTISVVDRYEFAQFMGAKQIYTLNIAFVGTSTQLFPDRFLETVARNQALNVKVTTDTNEAELWLRKK